MGLVEFLLYYVSDVNIIYGIWITVLRTLENFKILSLLH